MTMQNVLLILAWSSNGLCMKNALIYFIFFKKKQKMNKTQYRLMAQDVKENRANLTKYRKIFKYAYPFGDRIFKRLMINQVKPERFIAFLNAMMGLEGEQRIKDFSFRIQEMPALPSQKKPIFDIVGTNQAGEPIMVEVQQNASQLFIDRLFYYVSRAISTLVPEGSRYRLPHVYVLSILTEDLFNKEPGTYFHHVNLSKNGRPFYEKFDGFLVEVDKFCKLDARLPLTNREQSKRAEMLRFFNELMEEKPFSPQYLKNDLYAKFIKDVSLDKIEDELLLREVDEMTDIKYEKESSFLDGMDAKAREMAKKLKNKGVDVNIIADSSGLSRADVLAL